MLPWLITGVLLLSLLAYVLYHGWLREDVWSIAIYGGDEPLSLAPLAGGAVLTSRQLNAVPSRFVADPFLVRAQGRWYLFFEALALGSRRGVIGVVSSVDGREWGASQIVLVEPFHLSYPQVVQWQHGYYMLPETGEAGEVRLYRCTRFPDQWQFHCTLLTGTYWDPTVYCRDGRWWMFAASDAETLHLFHAEDLTGTWQPHPANPIVRGNPHGARPAGRLVEHEGRLFRFAQDGIPTYGSMVRVFEIDVLSTTEYREHELSCSPLLRGSGCGWNATGMHHIDVQRTDAGQWLAAVDGNRQRKVLNWRAGARHLINRFL